MRLLLLNLPYAERIVRRFKCSYNAPTFLLPPLELLSLGGIASQKNYCQTRLIDAIAQNISPEKLRTLISGYRPDLIVTLTGVESFSDDTALLSDIKSLIPQSGIVIFGYLATLFPEEILQKSRVDYCLINEPEETFSKLLDRLNSGGLLDIPGLAYRKDGRPILNQPRPRIEDLDRLPFPDRSLVNNRWYSEPMMGMPFTTVQSSRGCPYGCAYCVSTYGQKIVFRSAENVLAELDEIKRKFSIRYVRFMDDTFTLNRERVDTLCRAMIDRSLRMQWTCLSRPDTINHDMLRLMKNAGCRRIYLGIESGSQRLLDFFCRGYTVEGVKQAVAMIKKSGIEVTGFFMDGGPLESKEDFQATVSLARSLPCDYFLIDMLRIYPGTKLFEMKRHAIDFNLFPYKNDFRDSSIEDIYHFREREFYRNVYLRPAYLSRMLRLWLRYPAEALVNFMSLVRYLVSPVRRKKHDKYI